MGHLVLQLWMKTKHVTRLLNLNKIDLDSSSNQLFRNSLSTAFIAAGSFEGRISERIIFNLHICAGKNQTKRMRCNHERSKNFRYWSDRPEYIGSSWGDSHGKHSNNRAFRPSHIGMTRKHGCKHTSRVNLKCERLVVDLNAIRSTRCETPTDQGAMFLNQGQQHFIILVGWRLFAILETSCIHLMPYKMFWCDYLEGITWEYVKVISCWTGKIRTMTCLEEPSPMKGT